MRRPSRLALASTLLAAVAAAASAYPRPGRTEIASAALGGGAADRESDFPAISGDGRAVVFSSHATNLVPDDTNGGLDVFVYDRTTGRTELASVASDGTQGNNTSDYSGDHVPWDHEVDQPAISGDGRFVAFSSLSTNLVPGDTNNGADVFVHDRVTGTTERVSVSTDGAQADSWGLFPDISADGRFVTFSNWATNLVPGDTNGFQDVFVHDRVTGTTERVSVASDGTQGDIDAFDPSISGDGRYVAFHGGSTNLVPGDTNFTWDVFVHDRLTGRTERASVSTDGQQGNGGSAYAQISDDGRTVAFYGEASNLVPTDTNGYQDTFVHDRLSGVTRRASVSSNGAEGTGPSGALALSGDGRSVMFNSLATNLVPGDANSTDLFVHDLVTGITELANVSDDGSQAADGSWWLGISADGRFAVFASDARNLIAGRKDTKRGVFVRDRGPAIGVGGLSAAVAGERADVTGWATFSGAAVSAGTDPPADAGPAAREAGGELVGASVVLRPEGADLFVRLELASMPGLRSAAMPFYFQPGTFAPSDGGLPAVLYGLELRAAGHRYQVRGLRLRSGGLPSTARSFALYRCGATCEKVADLNGGMGTTGVEVTASVPLAALGDPPQLTGVRAFTALGEDGELGQLDDESLPDAGLPSPEVRLGVAPPGTPEGQVAFATPAALDWGELSGSLDIGLGDHDVWARACLGPRCGAASVRVHGG